MTTTQKNVLTAMLLGLTLTLLTLVLVVVLIPQAEQPATLERRLMLLAQSCLLPVTTLAFAIARLAAHRFSTPQDIDGSGLTTGTERARVLQATLQNTLEQLVLALAAYGIYALVMPLQLLAAMPAAAALFMLGRMLFFYGYARGASGRALGFALTFYPTLMLLAAVVATELRRAIAM